MPKFHFSPVVGGMTLCTARSQCIYSNEDHFEGSKSEALKRQEHILRKIYGDSFSEPTKEIVRGVTKVSKSLGQYTYYIDKEQKKALKWYTVEGYARINESLQELNEPSEKTIDAIKIIDKTLNNAPKRDNMIETYRYSSRMFGLDYNAMLEDPLPIEVKVPNFISTSSNLEMVESRSRSMTLVLEIPTEIKVLDLNALGASHHAIESEILIERGCNIRLHRREVMPNGRLKVYGSVTK